MLFFWHFNIYELENFQAQLSWAWKKFYTLGASYIIALLTGGWSNSQSVIRDSQQASPLVAHSHAPLDCNAFRPFWMSWDGGVIRVGTGPTVGQNEFMSFTDPTPTDVNNVAISTGFGATGEWTLYDSKMI